MEQFEALILIQFSLIIMWETTMYILYSMGMFDSFVVVIVMLFVSIVSYMKLMKHVKK